MPETLIDPNNLPPNINWFENGLYKKWVRGGKILGVFMIFLTMLMIYAIVIGLPVEYSAIPFALILISGIFVFVIFVWNENEITHIGFDENGFYAKLIKKRNKTLKIINVLWKEIKTLEEKERAGVQIKIIKKNEKKLSFVDLSKEIAIKILKEFQNWQKVNSHLYKQKLPLTYDFTKIRGRSFPVNWINNEYREKEFNTIKKIIYFQIFLIFVFIIIVVNFNSDMILILLIVFLLPLIFAVTMYLVSIRIPKEIAILDDEVLIQENDGIWIHYFEGIRYFILNENNLKLVYKNGVSLVIWAFTTDIALKISEAIEKFKQQKGLEVEEISNDQDISWAQNRTFRKTQLTFWVPIYLLLIYTFLLFVLIPIYPNLLFTASILLFLPYLFSLLLFPVWMELKYVPKEIGYSKDGIFCNYYDNESPKYLFKYILWYNVSTIDFEAKVNGSSGDSTSKKKNKNYIQIEKITGRNFVIGPIDDELYTTLRDLAEINNIQKSEISKII